MQDKFNAIKQKLKPIVTDDRVIFLAGAVTATIGAGAVVYLKTRHDYDQLLTLPLGKEAFNALVNDETNFVRFWTGKHDHVFRVILEQ